MWRFWPGGADREEGDVVATRRPRRGRVFAVTVVSVFCLLVFSASLLIRPDWVIPAAIPLMLPVILGAWAGESRGHHVVARSLMPITVGAQLFLGAVICAVIVLDINLADHWVSGVVASAAVAPGLVGLALMARLAPRPRPWTRWISHLATVLLLVGGAATVMLAAVDDGTWQEIPEKHVLYAVNGLTMPMGIVLLMMPYISSILRLRPRSGQLPPVLAVEFTCLRCGQLQVQRSAQCCDRCGLAVEVTAR